MNHAGRQLLAERHTLKVEVVIGEGGHTVRTLTATFKSKHSGKRKRRHGKRSHR